MALIRSFVMAFIQLLGSFNNEGSGKSLKGREKGMFQIELCKKEDYPGGFQMPLHYPRYDKADYENMEDWKLDMLLKEYGLIFKGTLDEKRAFAIGTFFWP